MGDSQISPLTIKRTQETLGRLIKRPQLTDKLLTKPPFRFLHDIVNAVIKEYGFLDGLYTNEELDIGNIKDRDGKINFLQKLIEVVKRTTDASLKAKPSKIVAGHEPEQTNKLLQAIAKAIDEKHDSGKAIETGRKKENGSTKPVKSKPVEVKSTVKKSTSTSQLKPVGTKTVGTKPVDRENNVTKQRKPVAETGSKDSLSKIKSVESKPRKLEPKPEEQISELQNQKKEVAADPTFGLIERTKEKTIIISQPFQESIPIIEDSTEIPADKIGLEIKSPKPEPEPEPEKSEQPEVKSEDEPIRKRSSLTRSQRHISNDDEVTVQNPEETVVTKPIEETVTKPIEENVTKPLKKSVKKETVKKSVKKSDSNESRPRTSLRPPSVRPASARPGAPRRRDRNMAAEIILEPNESIQMANINVRVDKDPLDDDGENLVIIEDPTNQLRTMGNVSADDGLNQHGGHLVQQILETQKEFLTANDAIQGSGDKETNDRRSEFDGYGITERERQTSAKQMDTLRDTIQKLTRSINPLGQLLDFLQEDIDSMQMERKMWRDLTGSMLVKLDEEERLTKTATEPLKQQLNQLNDQLKEQRSVIDATRAKILQDEQQILKLYREF